MARPIKCRKVCHYPNTLNFVPKDNDSLDSVITLTIDEYETIRLIDKEGVSQEECSKSMEVARTTVQKIYENARKKIATAIVDGLPLHINGGDFLLCDGCCNKDICSDCYKQYYHSNYKKPKGDNIMRIAVTYEDGNVFQHFGHSKQFKIYDVEDNKIIASEIVDTNGQGHGALAGVLHALNTDVLICGGIGEGAINALKAENIKLFGGVSGDCDMVVNGYLSGMLNYNPNVKCSHHHDKDHKCGSNGCESEHHCHND